MLNMLKKTIGVCLIGLRFGNITSLVLTYNWLAFFNRSMYTNTWNCLVM